MSYATVNGIVYGEMEAVDSANFERAGERRNLGRHQRVGCALRPDPLERGNGRLGGYRPPYDLPTFGLGCDSAAGLLDLLALVTAANLNTWWCVTMRAGGGCQCRPDRLRSGTEHAAVVDPGCGIPDALVESRRCGRDAGSRMPERSRQGDGACSESRRGLAGRRRQGLPLAALPKPDAVCGAMAIAAE